MSCPIWICEKGVGCGRDQAGWLWSVVTGRGLQQRPHSKGVLHLFYPVKSTTSHNLQNITLNVFSQSCLPCCLKNQQLYLYPLQFALGDSSTVQPFISGGRLQEDRYYKQETQHEERCIKYKSNKMSALSFCSLYWSLLVISHIAKYVSLN